MDIRTRSLLKIGLLANAFEWYEFSIFGFLAGLIGQLFFESSQPIIGLMRGFMLFAMSYLARPLGGLFFGLMGAARGNSAVLRLSLILMSVPTVLVGLLPTHSQVGIAATIGLLLLRLLQGFSAGGELPSSARYVFESSYLEHRSLLCSIAMSSPTIGVLTGSFVTFLLTQYFDHTTLLAWAWRIPFCLSIPLTVFIAYIRRDVDQHKPINQPRHVPIETVSQSAHFVKQLIKSISLISFGTVCFYSLLIWMPSYLHYFLDIPSNIAQFTNTFVLCASLPLYLLMGYCAKRWGYYKLNILSILLTLLFIIPLFMGLQSQISWKGLLILQLILTSIFITINSVTIETLAKLFPPENRSIGMSLAWSLPPAFIGSTTPLACSYMIHKTGVLLFPAFYIMFFGLFALPVALSLKAPSKNSS